MSNFAPIVALQKLVFTTTGIFVPYKDPDDGTLIPLQPVPSRWTLQVTGVDNAGAIQTPSAWDVILQGSIDGLAFNDGTASKVIEHVNGTQGNGDVVSTDANMRILRFIKLDIKTLTLGGSATKILVSLYGY